MVFVCTKEENIVYAFLADFVFWKNYRDGEEIAFAYQPLNARVYEPRDKMRRNIL